MAKIKIYTAGLGLECRGSFRETDTGCVVPTTARQENGGSVAAVSRSRTEEGNFLRSECGPPSVSERRALQDRWEAEMRGGIVGSPRLEGEQGLSGV